MAITEVGETRTQGYETVTIDISADDDLTTAVYLDNWKIKGVITPSAWTTADITFQGSHDNSTFNTIYERDSDTAYTVEAGASRYITIPVADTWQFPPYIKVATSAGQAADRDIILVLER